MEDLQDGTVFLEIIKSLLKIKKINKYQKELKKLENNSDDFKEIIDFIYKIINEVFEKTKIQNISNSDQLILLKFLNFLKNIYEQNFQSNIHDDYEDKIIIEEENKNNTSKKIKNEEIKENFIHKKILVNPKQSFQLQNSNNYKSTNSEENSNYEIYSIHNTENNNRNNKINNSKMEITNIKFDILKSNSLLKKESFC